MNINWQEQMDKYNLEKDLDKAADGDILAATRGIVRFLFNYYKNLTDQGFDKHQALALTMTLQNKIMEKNKNKKRNKDSG